MKLAVIIPVLNQFAITNRAIDYLTEKEVDYEIIVVDNGSDEVFFNKKVTTFRYDEPIGSYPVFHEALKLTDADILAFFHSDVFIYDSDWDNKILAQFQADETLGLIGFVGSNEIDNLGGRGLGTASNFQGRITYGEQKLFATPMEALEKAIETIRKDETYLPPKWSGSPAENHGKRLTGFMNAAVVDGCVMILRRKALEDIGRREDFPPHHFYDRLIATQLLEKKWKIGVYGIACDHISGQTANREIKWQIFAKKWCEEHHTSPGGLGVNWDVEIYKEAERQWLSEYRDKKHLIPIRV